MPSKAPTSIGGRRAASPTRRASTPASSREDGVGLVEVVVTCMLLVVVLALVVPSFGPARTRSDEVRARAIAAQLADGIRQFQRDHGGRTPGHPGTQDWNE